MLLLLFLIPLLFWYTVRKIRIFLKIDPPLKNVLITGCDTGFGRLTAEYLYQRGWHVFAICLTEKGANELRAECEKFEAVNKDKSGKLTTFIFSITDEKAVKNVIEQISKEYPEGLWGVINNAGISRGFLIEFVELDDYRRSLEVNFLGMVSVTKHALPLLRKSKGRIINMTSAAGVCAGGGGTTYCASKFAAEGFSDGLRQEMRPFGVKVAIIEPGFMNTNIVKEGFAGFQSYADARSDLVKDYSIPGAFPLTISSHPPMGDPKQVVEAYYHALTARFPFTRYWVGIDCWIVLPMYYLLPTFIMDRFLFWSYCNATQKKTGQKIEMEIKKSQ